MSKFSDTRRKINDAIRTLCARQGVILSRDQMRLVRKNFIKHLRSKERNENTTG